MGESNRYLSPTALRDDIRIIRPVAVGPEMFTVDFKRITSHGDLSQKVILSDNDIVYVPRSFLGDVNSVITHIEPLLNVLLLPATYRDLYTAGGGLRVDTCEPISTGTTEGFTRPLPGTAAGKPVVPAAEEDEERTQQDEEEEGEEGEE